jgi:hypothetical protein
MKLVRPPASDYNGQSQQFQTARKAQLACPYFMPVAKLDGGGWPHPARLPLGCGWSGHCTAPGHEGELPAQDILEAFCNLGYASGCGWAPPQRDWDAVRFAVSAPPASTRRDQTRDSAQSTARALRLSYICERDHRPVEQGDLMFDLSSATWLRPHDDKRVQKMAECFLESYLKKKV